MRSHHDHLRGPGGGGGSETVVVEPGVRLRWCRTRAVRRSPVRVAHPPAPRGGARLSARHPVPALGRRAHDVCAGRQSGLVWCAVDRSPTRSPNISRSSTTRRARTKYLDGTIYAMGDESRTHAAVRDNVALTLDTALRDRGCRVL